jgi:lipopolysaccharide heptosyltransferase II
MALYKDAALCESLAAAARASVESRYTSDMMMERTLAVYDEAISRQNILVVKLSALGDVILAVPSLRAIRAKFPNAVIKVLVGLEAREVLDRCPYINETIVADLSGRHRALTGLLGLAKELRGQCFDIVFDLQNNRKSHLLAALSMACVRYGYDNGKWSFLLNRRIKDDAVFLDPVEHQFRALKMAGIRSSDKRLELWPSEADLRSSDKFLADNWINPAQSLAGIHVRASARWATKNWPASHIAELCDALAKEYGARVVLTGSPSDRTFAESVASRTKSKPIIAAGRTGILELACLIKRFRVFITPDSAPMHIASAVGTPVIALFGPTEPARHLMPSVESRVISKSKEMLCGPCYKPDCRRKITCMKKITVEEVLRLAGANLAKNEEARV